MDQAVSRAQHSNLLKTPANILSGATILVSLHHQVLRMKFSFASRQLEKLRMCIHFAFQFFYEIGFWMLQFPNALKEAWIDISAQRTIFLLCSFPPELIEKVLQLIFSIHLCCITNPKHNSIGCANIQCFTTHKSKGLKVSQTRDFPPKNKFLLS